MAADVNECYYVDGHSRSFSGFRSQLLPLSTESTPSQLPTPPGKKEAGSGRGRGEDIGPFITHTLISLHAATSPPSYILYSSYHLLPGAFNEAYTLLGYQDKLIQFSLA